MLRRYKEGELQRLLFGNKLQLCATMRGAVKRDIPVELVGRAVSAMLTTRVFSTLGAKYLWAYLKMTNFKPESHITNKDFLIFAITLRIQLSVTAKTIKRYIIEAHKAILAAGHKPDHPRRSGVLTIVHGLPIPIGGQCRRHLDYCGIKWQHIKLWRGGTQISNTTRSNSTHDNISGVHDTQKSGNLRPFQPTARTKV